MTQKEGKTFVQDITAIIQAQNIKQDTGLVNFGKKEKSVTDLMKG